MSLVKVDGVSNEVFIPDQISDDDKSFLVERTENIISIATRANVEIGLELLKVEQRFRASKEFSGPKGWYQKWYMSLGFTERGKRGLVSLARLSNRGVDSDSLNCLPDVIAANLSEPALGSSDRFSGIATQAAKVLIDQGASVTEGTAIKRTPLNQLLAGEEVVKEKQQQLEQAEKGKEEGPSFSVDRKSAAALEDRLNRREASLKEAERRLASLASEKSALEAKYGGDNWRNEENIRKEFEAAIANARAEEQAKKAKPVVDTTEQDALKKQYEALLTQNQQLTTELASKAESFDRLLASTKKVEQKLEHAQGAAREWENYSTARRRGLIKANISHFWEASAMLGYCRKYPESHGDAMSDGFAATVEHLEDLAIDSMIAWLPFLPSEKLNALSDALTERGDIPPAETLDSRELTVINV